MKKYLLFLSPLALQACLSPTQYYFLLGLPIVLSLLLLFILRWLYKAFKGWKRQFK